VEAIGGSPLPSSSCSERRDREMVFLFCMALPTLAPNPRVLLGGCCEGAALVERTRPWDDWLGTARPSVDDGVKGMIGPPPKTSCSEDFEVRVGWGGRVPGMLLTALFTRLLSSNPCWAKRKLIPMALGSSPWFGKDCCGGREGRGG
jgi:hypothetical protein